MRAGFESSMRVDQWGEEADERGGEQHGRWSLLALLVAG
jgi:hypothetical protein